MITKYVADLMTKRQSSPVFDNPENYGLEYEDVTFTTIDGVKLSGWLVGKSDKIIIQSHFGVQCSRSGYTPKGKGFIKLWDKKISFLRQAKALVDAGYSVLMYDLRSHGNSQDGKNPYISWGINEAKDVIAAVEFASKRFKEIGLLSICMGNSSTTFAYGEGLAKYKNVKALVSVQPLNYSCFVKAMGIPSYFQKSSTKYIKEKRDIDLQISFIPFVKKITVPTMVIQNKNDPWTDMSFVKSFYDQLTVEKEMVWLSLDKKRAAAYDWLGVKPQKVIAWFDKYMKHKDF